MKQKSILTGLVNRWLDDRAREGLVLGNHEQREKGTGFAQKKVHEQI